MLVLAILLILIPRDKTRGGGGGGGGGVLFRFSTVILTFASIKELKNRVIITEEGARCT